MWTSILDKLCRQPSRVARYALPFWTILLALLVQGALQAMIGKERDFPYALFYLVSIIATAWIGSYIPGVIASLIIMVGLPASSETGFHLTTLDLSRVGLLCALSLIVSKVANVQRNAKAALRDANDKLDRRVQERTQDLTQAVAALEAEIVQHKQTGQKLGIQLERLNLLDQITRAIGERQDLSSVFQVAVRSLEEHLPVDFCCICLHNSSAQDVKVTCVGVNSGELAMELAMSEQARIPIDQNGLSRSVQGHLVYESDISQVEFPFPQRLSRGGLRSLVIAPLLVESQVFGVLITARRQQDGFTSTDCEFLRQLSEHVALAAHQAQTHAALQQAYDDLRQSQQTAMQQERLRALGQMASGIAHDINNAISPVSLYTEMILATEANLSPRVQEYLKTTARAIEDVAHTVSRMREFYRKQEPALLLAPVNLNTLVQQVVDFTHVRWSDMPQKRGLFVDLHMELMSAPPVVAGIESEIREALINLIFNAVDALPEGGKIFVRTRVSAAAGSKPSLDVEVTDTGVGMSEETRKRCLEPFFTTKGERGTGLGLAMVYGVAQRHEADVELDSTLGQGTTVRLRFPLSTSSTGNLIDLQKATALPPRMRLLVVDDDPLITRVLRETLEADGHLVAIAQGGQEGINAFQTSLDQGEPFAMVLSDLGMPHVDGRKVAKAIKTASPLTPVLLLTGWGQRLVAEGDVPAHVDRVLNKPPKIGELRSALAELAASLAADRRLACEEK